MMKALKRYMTISMVALGVTAMSATSHAAPICVYADYPTVLEVGQAGAPGSPILLGGYLVAWNGSGYQKVPLTGSLSLNIDGTVKLGWTSHFDFGSGNWNCPVGDHVVNTSLEALPAYDITYHGGEPLDEEADCPIVVQDTVDIISCEGLAPFDPDLLPFTAAPAGSNNR